MANQIFSGEFNFGGVQDMFSSANKSFQSGVVEGRTGKQSGFYEADEWVESAEIDSLSPDYTFYQDESTKQELASSEHQQQEMQQQSSPSYRLLDDVKYQVMSPPLQTCLEETSKLSGAVTRRFKEAVEPKEDRKQLFSLASLELLKGIGSSLKRLNSEKVIAPSNDVPPCPKAVNQGLSTEEIMRIAGAKFVQSSIQTDDFASMLNNLNLSSLSEEEIRSVELGELLLASAEKVGNKEFDGAIELLQQCKKLSSSAGNPFQRVVYYFCEALGEKIDREKGKTTPKGLGKEQSFDIYEAMMCPSSCNIAVIQDMPFSWVSHFAGIQAIIENVAEAKKIHIVDLEIRSGKHWTILMQALVSRSDCPVEHLKITAIGGQTSEKIIKNTGKRLMSFAETMDLPFSFKMVIVSDMMDLKEELFELDAEEKVAVFSEFILTSLITPPERLGSVMKVIRHLNPCIMVVTEVEANHNSPVFVNRFVETLFFVSAYFDCFDACLERDNPNRNMAEYMFFGEGVRKVLASEGQERNIRNVKIDVWRAFFARFRMVETELSMSSLYQAGLVVKKFQSWSSCTVDMDGKSLIIGWKGTPIHCLSVWKFV